MSTNITLQDILKKQDEVKAMIATHGKQAVYNELKRVFAENPHILQIAWCQFTPYFNDGDPCVFQVYDPEIKFTFEYVRDNIQPPIDYNNYPTRHKEWTEELAEDEIFYTPLLNDLIELTDLLKDVFGDHVKIVATPEGIEVEDYDHD